MQRFVLRFVLLAVLAVFGAAACTATQTGGSPAGSATAPTPGASTGGSSGGGAVCATAQSGAAATVTVEYKDFKPSTDPVTAKVGDVIGWTNGDSAPHSATLDDGSCDTDAIAQGATGLLVFNQPGTYTYHCKVHPTQMKDFKIIVTQ
jgi:plastocyanin